MNEEIEYAEMLEIPVSTVNVIKKKRRTRAKQRADLKERLISTVNDRVGGEIALAPYEANENGGEENADEAKDGKAVKRELAYSAAAYGNGRIDTVPIRGGGKKKKRSAFFDADDAEAYNGEKTAFEAYREYGEFATQSGAETADEWGRAATNEMFGEASEELDAGDDAGENGYESAKRARSARRASTALTVEFTAACLLCGAIFLTNVFMPDSAINTFFRNLAPSAEKTDTRVYSDFKLASVVSEFSDAEITVSPTGILTFTDECCVYPVASGEVAEVITNADGTYDVKISHAESFYGVIGGLSHVYYDVGDEVYSNVPVGYSNGEIAVRVSMYSNGELLNCYTVDDENCLAWVRGTED